MACLTNSENRGRRFNNKTKGMTGFVGRGGLPHQWREERGGVSKTRTATAQVSKGSGLGMLSGSVAVGGGNTSVVTSEATDKAGGGGRRRSRPGESEGVAVRQENPAGKSSVVAENPGGDRQGVGGVVESPRVINVPVVEELPWGDETSRATPEVDGVPG